MKKLMMIITALTVITTSANAMSYERAREQALFLTDKMAYELNLSEDQYEAAYEVNLDYLMSINTYDDLYGAYWRNRNLDLSYILLDWQYRAFCEASYFFRPLYWHSGVWHFRIYTRYPHRNYFYFGRPHFYVSYRGGHSWRSNGGRSWYHGRTYGRPHREGGHGMRDNFDRGGYKHRGDNHFTHGNNNGHRPGNSGNNNNGNNSHGNRPDNNGTVNNRPGHGGNNNSGDNGQGDRRGFNRPGNNGNSNNSNGSQNNRGGSFGRHIGNRNTSSNRVTERESSTRSTVTRGGNTRTHSFGTNRNSSTSRSVTRPNNTFTPRNSGSSAGRSSGGGNSNRSTNNSTSGRHGGSFSGRR